MNLGSTATTPDRGLTQVMRRLALTCAALLLGALVAAPTPASAVAVAPGTLGGFEQEGNLVVNSAGNLDWATATVTRVADDTVGANDSGFQGSSKEEQPTKWTCNKDGGDDPGKGNILRAYVSARIGVDGTTNFAYLDLAFVRAAGNGDAHVNFEFNRLPTPATSCPINRRPGDFLITYDFPGGSAPADIRAWVWSGTAWTEKTLQPTDAAAATNVAALADPLNGGSNVVARGFGEVTVDLLAAGLPTNLVGCPGFATVNVRSRSSHSITSALQDKLPPTGLNLSTCGTVIVHKVDNHDPARPLAGAVFGLYSGDIASGTPVKTCTSAADGSCTFSNVTPGSYSVKEISAPAGYSPDPSIKTVTVGFRQTKDLTAPFVDPRDTGFVRIVKQLRNAAGTIVVPTDPHALDGTSFVVYRDTNPNDGLFQAVETARLWPAETAPAQCTITGGTGSCSTGPLPTGGYRVHETVPPTGVAAGPDVNVTVSKGTEATATTVTYVNTLAPLNLNLVKSGPEFAGVGTTFTYTFAATTTGPRLHALSLVEATPDRCTTPLVGPTGDTGNDGFLEVGETWRWTCTHTVTADDPQPLLNRANITGTDDFGRTVTATDDHRVDLVHHAIHVVKSGPTSAHVGDTVTYGFSVTNTGDATLHDVSVVDARCATTPVRTGGDTNADGLLQVTETWVFSCTHVVTASDPDPLPNTATACGDDPLDAQVCDSGDHTVDLIHPAIRVIKSGPTSAHVGDTVTYGFNVTNIGDTVLHDVGVVDARCATTPVRVSGDTNSDDLLQFSETWLFSCTHVVTASDPDPLPNTATACGDDPLSTQVCDSDDHSVDLVHPAINVLKSGPASGVAGATVTYSFTVTNTGDTVLVDVVVTDDVLGPIGTIPSLPVGATATLTKTFVVPTSSAAVTNIATACGDDPLAKEVCDTDTHRLTVTRVLGEVLERPDALPRTGGDSQPTTILAGSLLLVGLALRGLRRRQSA